MKDVGKDNWRDAIITAATWVKTLCPPWEGRAYEEAGIGVFFIPSSSDGLDESQSILAKASEDGPQFRLSPKATPYTQSMVKVLTSLMEAAHGWNSIKQEVAMEQGTDARIWDKQSREETSRVYQTPKPSLFV